MVNSLFFSGSFQSAVSSLENLSTGFIGRKKAPTVPADIKKPSAENEKSFPSKVTILLAEFHIRRLLLEVEDNERPLIKFQLDELSARLTKKNFELAGQFCIGGCICHQTKFRWEFNLT